MAIDEELGSVGDSMVLIPKAPVEEASQAEAARAQASQQAEKQHETKPVATATAKRSTAGRTPSTSFKHCRPSLSQEVIEVVTKMGFESMTPVQVRESSLPLCEGSFYKVVD